MFEKVATVLISLTGQYLRDKSRASSYLDPRTLRDASESNSSLALVDVGWGGGGGSNGDGVDHGGGDSIIGQHVTWSLIPTTVIVISDSSIVVVVVAFFFSDIIVRWLLLPPHRREAILIDCVFRRVQQLLLPLLSADDKTKGVNK